MKKINTKNILKKIFKRKKTSKKSVKKLNKPKKVPNKLVNKKIKKNIKVKKLKKKIKLKQNLLDKKKPIENSQAKQENTKIIKSSDQKPEIKKIKVQPTEKKEYKLKDYVVYPKHGVGVIKEFKKIIIGGIDVEVYIIDIAKEKLELKFPVNKQYLLRPPATVNQVNKCISILKSKPKVKRSMWSRRAQEYEAKISSGKIYELAEVVRDLNKGDDLMVDQSYSERQLFEKAYERILSEFQIILGLNSEDAQKKLDKALKRNLDVQQPKAPQKIETTTSATPEELEESI